MTEVRRVAWPELRDDSSTRRRCSSRASPGRSSCSTSACIRFQEAVGEITGHPVAVYQRIDQAGQKQPLDQGVLDDTDTLMVFGLDHLVTEQEAAPEEIEALRAVAHARRNAA